MISLILVNYFSDQMIAKLISVLKHPEIEFIIVDNSSTFSSTSTSENIRILVPGQNLGFGKAVNHAAKSGLGEVIVLLNPDVIIELESILKLASYLVSDEKLGIVAPLLVEKQHSGPFLNGGYWPTLWKMLMHVSASSRLSHRVGLFRGLFGHRNSKPKGELIEVDWVSGACLAIRLKDFELIGGFNERWFMYCEDMELSFQIGELGMKVGIFPDSIGQHIGGSSDSRKENIATINTLWLTNLFQFYKSFFSQKSTFRLFLWIQISSFGYGLRWLYVLFCNSKNLNSSFDRKSEVRKYLTYVRTLQRCFVDEFR